LGKFKGQGFSFSYIFWFTIYLVDYFLFQSSYSVFLKEEKMLFILAGIIIFLIVFICIAHLGSKIEQKITKIMDK